MGVLGMSLDDFSNLEPREFNAVVEAHWRHEEQRMHDDWERMRMLATITIQPHVSQKVTARNLLPFPWEKKGSTGRTGNTGRAGNTGSSMSKEEQWWRLQKLLGQQRKSLE